MSQPPARRDASDVEAIAATTAYRELIERLRRRIRESQARAAGALNTELVMLYWSIGRDILAQQQAGRWGDDVVGRIAEDLATSTGSVRGFSRRNLFYMRRFAALWPEIEKVQTLTAQSAGRTTRPSSMRSPGSPNSTCGMRARPPRTAGPSATSRDRSTSAFTSAKERH
ncbi:MAG: DUF1016 N-terminal domain-containing protein [Solirubrobacteraceae bacterium]